MPEPLLRRVEKLVTPTKQSSSQLADELVAHFDAVAERWDDYKRSWAYYHAARHAFILSIIAPGASVLEVGCATGQLLGALGRGRRVGVDLSARMIDVARARHPDVEFHVGTADTLPAREPFDYVILDNLVEYVPEVHAVFAAIVRHLHPFSKVIITSTNPLWSALVKLAHLAGTGTPDVPRNFTSNLDLINLLELGGYDVVESGWRLPCPVGLPGLARVANTVGPRLPVVRGLSLVEYVIARLAAPAPGDPRATVVIPCFNEVENIGEAVERTAQQPGVGEIVVVDDASTDGTADVVRRAMTRHPQVRLVSYAPHAGKAVAVQRGFAAATQDIVVILDADLSVAPEELPHFIDVIRAGRAEFVNGSRLVYPMEPGAMKLLNYLGNKFFGIVLSLIIGQRNTDTLCGTKAFLRRYLPLMRVGAVGWGDFDLLFSAARLKLKMVEWPVRYRQRRRGESKMRPFRELGGMLRICWRGLREIP
ncbi:MAG TPA: bifunctional class I SAM-dependent methyltransferase/glycosyltransferase family 2 protein [Solirubrobacteraceae bacterium]|jgi:2-polyprenyl-3-methyl-5-hydroxy-6-metoxy-1,4-benzoquinol methylase